MKLPPPPYINRYVALLKERWAARVIDLPAEHARDLIERDDSNAADPHA